MSVIIETKEYDGSYVEDHCPECGEYESECSCAGMLCECGREAEDCATAEGADYCADRDEYVRADYPETFKLFCERTGRPVDEEEEDEEICDTPGCGNSLADGEGFDGYCGECADKRDHLYED